MDLTVLLERQVQVGKGIPGDAAWGGLMEKGRARWRMLGLLGTAGSMPQTRGSAEVSRGAGWVQRSR